MSYVELVSKIKKALGLIIIDDGDKVISAGSGVIINEKGRLLTAKHVIAEDDKFFKGQYIVKLQGMGKTVVYEPKTASDFAINMEIPKMWNSINIDLAILEPIEEIETPFLPVADDLAKEGQEVFLAGYPDDYELVLDFMSHANTLNPDISKMTEYYEKKIKYYMRQYLFRKAIIGNTQKLTLQEPNPFNQELIMAQYWIDQNLTYGGSGGPVVGVDGKIYGIIIRKGLTDAKRFMIQGQAGTVTKLPSGTGIALSPHIVIKWVDELA
mgnify:CR=1 FL=1